MQVKDAIFNRRAVKHFDADHKITAAEEKELLETTIQSPTSFNIQHWRFVILRDSDLRAKIREEHGNDQAQMTDASLLVLFTADMKAWQKEPSRYFANAPKDVAEMLVNWMGPFHEGREWLQRDEAQRSIGIAMQTMMLAAQGLGYQSCPMIGFDIEEVAKLINLPDDHVMGPMVA
ncbi:nitroreductase family protein, partial [Rhodopirellula bahusiensis]